MGDLGRGFLEFRATRSPLLSAPQIFDRESTKSAHAGRAKRRELIEPMRFTQETNRPMDLCLMIWSCFVQTPDFARELMPHGSCPKHCRARWKARLAAVYQGVCMDAIDSFEKGPFALCKLSCVICYWLCAAQATIGNQRQFPSS